MDGSNAPNIDKLILIAEFFNVSIDYLVGKDKRHTEEELVQNIVNYTSFSAASIEELKTEKLIAENNTKEYSNYFKITNSFIQSRIFLDITLCVTKLENSLKEKIHCLICRKRRLQKQI